MQGAKIMPDPTVKAPSFESHKWVYCTVLSIVWFNLLQRCSDISAQPCALGPAAPSLNCAPYLAPYQEKGDRAEAQEDGPDQVGKHVVSSGRQNVL